MSMVAAVYDVITSRAVERPLSTSEVVAIYNAAHPGAQLPTAAIASALRGLADHEHVDTFDGTHDTAALVERGVTSPRRGWRYWALPTTEEG